MATGTDVIEGLRKTGTGEAKLAPALALVQEKPNSSAKEVVEALRRAGASEITLAKADHLANGQPIEDILGKPPPHQAEKEAESADLKKAIAKVLNAHTEKVEKEQQQSPKLAKAAH